MKAVGKKYGGKKLAEDAQKSSSEVEGKGEASAAVAAAGGGKQNKSGGFGVLEAEGHYAECYPGGMEEYDATYDSDEDVDFSKMDMVRLCDNYCKWTVYAKTYILKSERK